MKKTTINIARKMPAPGWDGKPRYKHFFRIEMEQYSDEQVNDVWADVCTRYPAPEFHLTMTISRVTSTAMHENFSTEA